MTGKFTVSEQEANLSLMDRFKKLFREYPVFVWCALTIPALSQFANYLAPSAVVFKGQPLSVIFSLIGGALVLLTWLPFKSTAQWTRLGMTTLLFIMAALVLQLLLIQTNGSLFNITVVVTGEVALLLLLKPTTRAQSIAALVYFCFLIPVEAIASLILDHFGLAPSGFLYYRVGWSRLPFISDVLGIDTRWEGPFGNVNFAGPMGAFVLLFGLMVRGWKRIVLVSAGALILSLSQARDSLAALGAGLIVLVLASPRFRNAAHAGLIRLMVIGGAIAAGVAYIGIVDPTLGLRTDVWRDYLTIAQEHLFTGAGDSGVAAYVTGDWHQSAYPPNHAHSVLLDLTARYGILMGLLSITILAALVLLAVQRAKEHSFMGLTLIVFVIVAGLAETLYSWIYLSVQLVPLLAVLLVTGTKSKAREKQAELISEP